nr:PD-(D/E)XK nuclease family protein [Oscillibacter sp.]
MDQLAEEMRCSDFVPLAFELSFGERGELPAVTVSEPDAELRIGGKVDRVDGWVKDNRLYLRVVDYKSGKKALTWPPSGWAWISRCCCTCSP